MTRPAPAFSACLVPGGGDDGQERWLEHWDVARSARASVTCVVTGLVPEPSALYPLDSDRVVLMLCFASELRTAAAGWTVLTEIPTNSVRATALASWGMWERRRTECVLSTRRQVQRRAIGRRDLHLYETLRLSARHHHRNSQTHRRNPGNRQPGDSSGSRSSYRDNAISWSKTIMGFDQSDFTKCL